MFDSVPKLLHARYKQLLGISVAAVILFVIIVPFQSQQSLNAAPLCGLLGGHDYGPCPQSATLFSDARNAATAAGASTAAANAAAVAASSGASPSAAAAAAAAAAAGGEGATTGAASAAASAAAAAASRGLSAAA